MKLKLLVLSIGLLWGSAANAYEVSTEVQKKNVLLEVFTGIHCGNCPDGDVYTDNLLRAQPEHVFAIDIHSGYYAVPNAGQPDYRIDEGEAIDVEMGANSYGYPGGAINRRHFPEEKLLVLGRSSWTRGSKNIHEEDAPVNLHLSSVFDGATRELKVTVEGYYTQPVDENDHFLHVMLIQDNIYGYQSGAANSSNYNHRHMLRACLTPLWGDTIYAPELGAYFTREYTYSVPQAIKNIAVKPEDLDVIAFVSVNKKEVLNVTGRKPEYTNYPKPLAATLLAPKPPVASRYGYRFFDVVLKNESDRLLTSADFQVTVNNNAQTVNWTGEIASFHSGAIRLPVEPYAYIKENQYQVQLTALNGESFDGNALQGTFSAPVETTPTIYIEIKTDSLADENTFIIRNGAGVKVVELGPYPKGVIATYKDTVQLPPAETYCLEITDAWGDGIMKPRGSYKLYKDNRSLFAQNYEIRTLGDRVFFQTTLPPSPTALLPVGQGEKTVVTVNRAQKTLEIVWQSQSNQPTGIALYSIDGKRLLDRAVSSQAVTLPVAAFPSGIYILVINQQEKREIIKIKI